MLTYHGIDIQQEALILAYCQRFYDQEALSRPDGSAVTLDGLTEEQMIDAASTSILRHANFNHFGEIADQVASLTEKGLHFTLHDVPSEELVAVVSGRLRAGCPVAISAQVAPKTFHVGVAFAAEPSAIHSYDPAQDGQVVLPTATTAFARDVLVLERMQI